MIQQLESANLGGSGSEKYSEPEPPSRIGIPGIVSLIVIGLLAYVFAYPHSRLMKLLAAVAISVPVHLIGIVICGWVTGIRIERISVYFGGAIWRQLIGKTWLAVGWLPVGGSVKFPGTDNLSDPAGRRHGVWQAVHPLLRAGVSLSGCIALLAFTSILIGVRHASAEVVEFPRQCIDLFSEDSSLMFTTFFEFIDTASFPLLLGIVAAKFAAINLLPLPVCNGGAALLALSEWIIRRRVPEKLVNELSIAALLPVFVLLVRAVSIIPKAWRSTGY